MGKRGGTEWITPAEFQALAAKSATPQTVRGLALRKDFLPEIKAVDDTAHTIQFRITTGTRDRDRDTINPAGWDIADYLKNPIVLFAHDYASLPIAKAISVTTDANGLVALDEFTPADLNPFGDCVYRMVKAGFLNATSVGFRPMEWVYNEDVRGVDFSRQALLEHSIVPIPANAEALVEARSAGIDLTPLLAWAEEKLDTWKKEDGLYVPKGQVEAVFRILSTKTISVPEIIERPFPNFHACRLRNPADFQDGSFRTSERNHEGKKYSVIQGRLTGEDTLTDQAFRYAKDSWSASQAGSHCKSHDGSFEAASGSASVCESCREEVEAELKRGRVLSSTNEGKLRQAKGHIDEVLAQLETAPETEGLEITEHRSADPVLEIEEPAKEELRIEQPDNGHGTIEIAPETIISAVRESLAGLMPGIAREVQEQTRAAINRARGRID